MPSAPDWRSASAYAYLHELNAAEFAAEFLRLNPAYRRDHRAAVNRLSHGQSTTSLNRWDLKFPFRLRRAAGPNTSDLAAAPCSCARRPATALSAHARGGALPRPLRPDAREAPYFWNGVRVPQHRRPRRVRARRLESLGRVGCQNFDLRSRCRHGSSCKTRCRAPRQRAGASPLSVPLSPPSTCPRSGRARHQAPTPIQLKRSRSTTDNSHD